MLVQVAPHSPPPFLHRPQSPFRSQPSPFLAFLQRPLMAHQPHHLEEPKFSYLFLVGREGLHVKFFQWSSEKTGKTEQLSFHAKADQIHPATPAGGGGKEEPPDTGFLPKGGGSGPGTPEAQSSDLKWVTLALGAQSPHPCNGGANPYFQMALRRQWEETGSAGQEASIYQQGQETARGQHGPAPGPGPRLFPPNHQALVFETGES